MTINYDYYRIFYAVAQCRSFTRAAEVLKNNQPNITRCMKNLEQELGCKLFHRSNKGITLTPEGQRLSPAGAPDAGPTRHRRASVWAEAGRCARTAAWQSGSSAPSVPARAACI